MSLKIHQLIFLVFLQMIFCSSIITAQETNFFVDKPDRNIKRVLIYDIDNNGDTLVLSTVIEFNKKGQKINESQPEVHVNIDYEYDKEGRLQKKEALYGESFANGVITYQYSKGVEIERNQAMGFYAETRKELNKKGKIAKKTTFVVAGGMGESKIETTEYKYNKDTQVLNESTNISYYELELEPGEIPEMKPTDLILKLKESKIIKKEHFDKEFKYNNAKKLIQKDFFVGNANVGVYQVSYEYNTDGLLMKELKVCLEQPESQENIPCEKVEIKREYNTQKQLESITTERDYFISVENFKDGRLVSSYGRYAADDSYRYGYKYEYYAD